MNVHVDTQMDTGKMTTIEKYIHRGMIRAELDELFKKQFQQECYAGMEIEMNHLPIKLSIKLFDPRSAIGEGQFRLRQLQNMIAQRLKLSSNDVNIVFEKVMDKGLEPAVHAEALRNAFLKNDPYKRAINSIIRNVRYANGQGVMIKVSGKVKGQRARTTRFIDGLLIQSGRPAKDYIKTATTEAKCKQGVIGITVSIMLPYDQDGIRGPNTISPDKIMVLEPERYN